MVSAFKAFFDASGTRRTNVLTVTGFSARVTKWSKFDEEWKTILDSHGVSMLHMTDFASSQREYKSWRGQSVKRQQFIESLSKCIRKTPTKGLRAASLSRTTTA